MQPPNWTRSHIRRLFLVSLGVPVDLDEILPPSKQHRLVLPNIDLAASSSPSSPGAPAGTPRASTALDRLKNHPNSSSTSLDSKSGPKPHAGKPTPPKRTPTGLRPPPAPPAFDPNAAALRAATTPAALAGHSTDELRAHVEVLRALCARGEEVAAYWRERVREAGEEKEALEGVIENLVGFVKGRREREGGG